MRRLIIALVACVGVPTIVLGAMLAWPLPTPDPDDTIAFGPKDALDSTPPRSAYIARDGTELPLRVRGPEDAGLVVILLHGSAAHGGYLHEMAEHIVAHAHARVYVPVLRGHGFDPAQRGDIADVDQLERDLVDLIMHVRTRMPGARVALAGHSSGGGLALRVAAGTHDDDLAGALLIAPFFGPDAPTARSDSGGFVHVAMPRMIALSLLNAVGIEAFDHLPVLRFNIPENMRPPGYTTVYSWRMANGFGPRDYATDLAGTDMPLTIVVGEQDDVFHAGAYAPILAEHAPHGELVILPGGDHIADVTTGERALEIYVAWLEGL